MSTATENPVRDNAQAILKVLREHPGDEARLQAEVRTAVNNLIKVPGLDALGVKREANHVPSSLYLYFDTEMKITLDILAKDKTLPVHEHGAFEAFGVYRGSLLHTVYQQVDDNTQPGYAELKVIDDRKLQQGDYALVAPPADIHGFTGLEEGTALLTVATSHYIPNRRYFDPENRTYKYSATKNTR